MMPQARMRRIGWFALMMVCTLMYGILHFQVWSVSSDVKKAERSIVRLEQRNMLLETEFLTRSSQFQLAAWNRVDFGYSAPEAAQFIENERQLERFSSPAAANGPKPVQLAGYAAEEEAPPFPQLVSPITGRPLDMALVEPARGGSDGDLPLVAAIADRTLRVPMTASAPGGSAATVRVLLGGSGQ